LGVWGSPFNMSPAVAKLSSRMRKHLELVGR
jgi:hypothetical protein